MCDTHIRLKALCALFITYTRCHSGVTKDILLQKVEQTRKSIKPFEIPLEVNNWVLLVSSYVLYQCFYYPAIMHAV